MKPKSNAMFAACLLALLSLSLGMREGRDPRRRPEISQRINAFTVELVRHLAVTGTVNGIVSPQSVFHGLAASYAATGGETRREMARALEFPKEDAKLLGALKDLRRQILRDGDRSHVTASMDSGIWMDGTHAQFQPEYRQTIADALGDVFHTARFGNAATAAAEINSWVSKQTRGRIPGSFRPSDIASRSRPGVIDEPALVAVNAVYFKARWLNRFEADGTRDLPFHAASGLVTNVPMMHLFGELALGGDADFQYLCLPFEHEDFALCVYLPRQTASIPELVRLLDGARMERLAASAYPGNVDVRLPRFEMFAERMPVKETLQQLGMRTAFDAGRADFDRMIVKTLNAYRVYLSDVWQDAWVKVDEEGAEAAAATYVSHFSIGCAAGEFPHNYTFHADHPFLFTIEHLPSGSILFAGWIGDAAAARGSAAVR